MRELNWHDFSRNTMVVGKHKLSDKELICFFDADSIYWDFFYADTDTPLAQCSTNVNEIAQQDFYYIKTIAEGEVAEDLANRLTTSNFKFYPDFKEMLMEVK